MENQSHLINLWFLCVLEPLIQIPIQLLLLLLLLLVDVDIAPVGLDLRAPSALAFLFTNPVLFRYVGDNGETHRDLTRCRVELIPMTQTLPLFVAFLDETGGLKVIGEGGCDEDCMVVSSPATLLKFAMRGGR